MKENNTQVIEKITKFIQEEIEIWLEKERWKLDAEVSTVRKVLEKAVPSAERHLEEAEEVKDNFLFFNYRWRRSV